MARKEVHERAPLTGSSQKRLLLAGPVNRPDKNSRPYPRFAAAASYLRNLFVQVLDPSDVMLSATANTTYREHVDHSLGLFQQADGIVLLPEWEGSILAQTLAALAHGCQLPIFQIDTHGELKYAPWGHRDPDLDWLTRPAEKRKIL